MPLATSFWQLDCFINRTASRCLRSLCNSRLCRAILGIQLGEFQKFTFYLNMQSLVLSSNCACVVINQTGIQKCSHLVIGHCKHWSPINYKVSQSLISLQISKKQNYLPHEYCCCSSSVKGNWLKGCRNQMSSLTWVCDTLFFVFLF